MTHNRSDRILRAAMAVASQRAAMVWACVGFLAVDTFSSSFSHVHDLAAEHHQAGWFAWASAVGVEMLPITAWLVRQYRAHTNQGRSWLPYLALASGVTMSLGANLAEAHPHGQWDVIFACWPAYVFALVMLMAETTLTHRLPDPASQDDSDETVDSGGADDTEREEDEEPSERRKPARTRGARIDRAEYIAALKVRLEENPKYQINYAEEAAATGYSRSWLEKAWADAQRETPSTSPVRVVA